LKPKSIPTLSILLIYTVLGSTLILSLTPVFATNPACGATIKKNTTLTGNIGPCSTFGLVIGVNGITLNCAGHTISGTGTSDGISLGGSTEVTVKNCKVTGFAVGFVLPSSLASGNTLTGNTANNNVVYGFYIYGASGNTLTGNTANSNGFYGFHLYSSSKNTLTGNTANNNVHLGFLLTGISSTGSSSNTLTGNTANSNGYDGFYLESSSKNNKLTGNTANNNGYDGFYLTGSSGNKLKGNTANSNTQYGYFDNTISSSAGVPHWDTGNSYGTTVAKLSATGDKGTGNGSGLAGGNPNILTATSPF